MYSVSRTPQSVHTRTQSVHTCSCTVDTGYSLHTRQSMPPRRGHSSPVRPARARRRASSSDEERERDDEVVYAAGDTVDYHSVSRRRWVAATIGESFACDLQLNFQTAARACSRRTSAGASLPASSPVDLRLLLSNAGAAH